jgi:glycosyltransferase involved in cell wall biosynthesis
MRILFVADGRSPIALNWIAYFVSQGHEVHLASTFACQPKLELASLQVIPVAFSNLKKPLSTAVPGHPDSNRQSGIWGAQMVGLRTAFRQWLGPLTLVQAGRVLAQVIRRIQPDLVHAMRIPYEGMLAARAQSILGAHCPPVLVSVWGNDFTLHGQSNPWMAALTRWTLRQASALHTDCHRDLALAWRLGFAEAKPSIELPGAGGIQSELFHTPQDESERHAYQVIHPRGVRAYVRNDIFFKALPQILDVLPQARFICPTMQGETQIEKWLDQYQIRPAVELLPKVNRDTMADLFRQSHVVVSPTTHDGTPNTLLEAMACGCFPVAGDLESIREWITHGENGLLVDLSDPQTLAQAILRGLQDSSLRYAAAQKNVQLISERAEYTAVMHKAESFYLHLSATSPVCQ